MNSQAPHFPNPFQELMDQLSAGDPRIRAISEFLEQQASIRQAASPEIEGAMAQKILAKSKKVIQENTELAEENRFLRERLEILAAALGACSDCWGEDSACSSCSGEGVPGCFLPDRDAFAGYVLPAVRTLHKASATARSSIHKRREAG